MTDSINESMNYEAVYRTAPATPGLLNISQGFWVVSWAGVGYIQFSGGYIMKVNLKCDDSQIF